MRTLFYLVIAVAVSSCTKTVGYKDYVSYMENPANGLNQQARHYETIYQLQYKTVDYVTLYESRSDNFSEFNSIRQDFEGHMFFNFRILQDTSDIHGNSIHFPEAGEVLMMENNLFKLIFSNDTISTSLIHCGYNSIPGNNYIFFMNFPVSQPKKDVYLYFLGELIGLPEQVFKISRKDFSKIPHLNLQERS